MRTKLIATVASVGFTALGVTGLAFAQDSTNRQSNGPATERMEKGAQMAPEKREEQPRTGQAAQPERREGETRTGQAAQPEKREEPRTGQAAQPERREEPRTGQAAQPERREEKRTGQAAQPERREEQRTGEAAQPERRDEQRNGQAAQPERREGAGAQDKDRTIARDVRVRGNLRISTEIASRISERLMREGSRENININIDVGAPLPADVELLPLPAEIVERVPEYRGYDYFIDNDEIVFVQPSTREVVGMIDVGGSSATAETPRIAGAKPCPVD